jgi:hypothetical protein
LTEQANKGYLNYMFFPYIILTILTYTHLKCSNLILFM